MFKLFRISLPLILAVFALTGCRTQPPTPISDGGLSADGADYDSDGIIPGMDSDWSTADGLEPRDDDAAINAEDNTYNGRPMVRGILQNVYFGFDEFSISATERFKLQAAADHLAANPSDGLLIEGYCDNYGTEDYNLALGDRRANSARDYLATLGTDTSAVDTLSKGSLEATADISKSESGKDRRVELIILK